VNHHTLTEGISFVENHCSAIMSAAGDKKRQ